MTKAKYVLLLITLLILLSRVFFLNAGYGSEEDAWGVGLTAKHIAATGEYEASRLPGHPLQEMFYAAIALKSSVAAMNAVTAFFSLLVCVFFFLIVRKLNYKQCFLATLCLAFTPILYIHSTDSMDYVWALAFMMMSFYWLLHERYIFAGILLGFAVGCRITSILMFIPFAIYLFNNSRASIINIFRLGTTTALVSLAMFYPVINKYGWGFFHYYDQFPYPPVSKVIFKATIGVWGSIGSIVVFIAAIIIIKNFINQRKNDPSSNKLTIAALIAIILYTGLYIMLPQKSAYFIPLIPFVILLAVRYLNHSTFRIFACSIIVSSFLFGINLSDTTRGAEPSTMSKDVTLGGQTVHLDFLYGPVMDDYLKRKARINFTEQIVTKTNDLTDKSIIIAGWWLNPIEDKLFGKHNGNIKYVYTIDEPDMMENIDKGFTIYYLPEMDSINDLRYKITTTKVLCEPLFK
jgi:hypothetical protein